MAVKSFKARANATVNVIEITCQDYQLPEDIFLNTWDALGGWFSWSTTMFERAIGRSALTGLHATLSPDGERIWRLTAPFDQLDGTGTNTRRHGWGGEFDHTFLPSHGLSVYSAVGGGGGNGYIDQFRGCSKTAALVGLSAWWGPSGLPNGRINGLVGICANVVEWVQDKWNWWSQYPPATPNTPTTRLAVVGRAQGMHSGTFMCPGGHFLTGWVLGASDGIDGIFPVCRRFSPA
jgi:hypothetical protein